MRKRPLFLWGKINRASSRSMPVFDDLNQRKEFLEETCDCFGADCFGLGVVIQEKNLLKEKNRKGKAKDPTPNSKNVQHIRKPGTTAQQT